MKAAFSNVIITVPFGTRREQDFVHKGNMQSEMQMELGVGESVWPSLESSRLDQSHSKQAHKPGLQETLPTKPSVTPAQPRCVHL